MKLFTVCYLLTYIGTYTGGTSVAGAQLEPTTNLKHQRILAGMHKGNRGTLYG